MLIYKVFTRQSTPEGEKGSFTFTYELDQEDLNIIALSIAFQCQRVMIRRVSNSKVIGRIEFRTMQFHPFDDTKTPLSRISRHVDHCADEEEAYISFPELDAQKRQEAQERDTNH